VWAPLSIIDSTRIPHHHRSMRWLAVIARARPGSTPAHVHAELQTVAGRLAATYPADNTGWNDVTVLPLRRDIVGDSSSALVILLGAVALLLIIACANVANLLLTRGAGRQRELAIRTAMGASRGRIVTQLLVESVVLGVTAGVLGLTVAAWAVDLVVQLAGARLPRAAEIGMDLGVAGFAVALSLVTSFAFGLVPALMVTGDGPGTTLRDGSRGSGGPRLRRLRQALVAAEFAIALTLLAAGGLLVNSLWRSSRIHPGFDAARVLAIEFVIPTAAYPQGEQYRAVYGAMLERVQRTRGVVAAAGAQVVPGGGADESGHTALWRAVSPDYFRVLGVPLLRGRAFSAADRSGAPPVAIVSAALARRLWPTEDAVGQRVELGGESVAVVGVAGDVRSAGLLGPPEPVLYQPQAQHSRRRVALLVRGAGAPEDLARVAVAAIQAVDPHQAIRRIRTLEQVLATSLDESRFLGIVLGTFAGFALLLSTMGLYGVIAYAVAQRGREIGIRLALGAAPRRIFRMVLGEGLRQMLLGLTVGLVGAFAAGRVLASRLSGVGAADPLTFGAVIGLLVAVGLLACCVPARRAARLDPVVALKAD
jgi:putative ABC transport system permease protein